jgi:hypothetical protein
MRRHGTPRIIGELATVGEYKDTFQAQIMFEGWLSHFPHVQELYLRNLCDIAFEPDRIVVRANFTDQEWTMWCLKHSTPVARRCFGK